MNGNNNRPIGWPLLPLPDENGRLQYPSLELSIRQQIQVILQTRPGEQLMAHRFGAGLENFLHDSNNITTRRRIRDLIMDSLNLWESRILVDRVDVREVPDEPTHIRVEIAYRIRRTGLAQQLGLTMALEA